MNELSNLLDQTGKFIREYVVCTPEQNALLSLWALHTHSFGANEFSPYMWVNSPMKRSGKSTLLETMNCIVARPFYTGRVTAAVLVRKIDSDIPTLLLDETDTTFHGNSDYSQALRGVLNTGCRRGGKVSVMQGGVVTDFSSYCPKMLAGLGSLPGTIEDRSIPIRLQRRLPDETVSKFRQRDAEAESLPLKLEIVRWTIQNRGLLMNGRADAPDELNDRTADVIEPLLVLADLAGEEWADRARKAAINIFSDEVESEDEDVQLFNAIRRAFEECGEDRMSSVHLCSIISGEVGRMKPKILADRLRPFGVRSNTVRLPDDRILKGYYGDDFENIWRRLCQ